MLVYIIRHGETNENRMGIIQGQMDTQLNEAGRYQARITGEALKNVNFIAAYSSDSSRAADTARAIVAHHLDCELVLDSRLRERYMGSLSGTKAPARRPLPSDVESSSSIGRRLRDFWDNTLVPLCVNTPTSTSATVNKDMSALASSLPPVEPAVLIVSHGATISKLIRDTLLIEHGYTVSCDIARRGIYNTSISILQLNMAHDHRPNSTVDVSKTIVVSGKLVKFASVSHLVRQENMVKENADILGSPESLVHKQ